MCIQKAERFTKESILDKCTLYKPTEIQLSNTRILPPVTLQVSGKVTIKDEALRLLITDFLKATFEENISFCWVTELGIKKLLV